MPRRRKVDPLVLAELLAQSIDAGAESQAPLAKEHERAWSPDLANALDRRHVLHFYRLRGQVLRAALLPGASSRQKELALKAGEVLDDRMRGRPSGVVPERSPLTVIFGGLNPDLLPNPSSKPALPKTVNGQVVPPPSPRNIGYDISRKPQDVPRAPQTRESDPD